MRAQSVEGVNRAVGDVKTGVNDAKTAIGGLQTDVSAVKSTVSELVRALLSMRYQHTHGTHAHVYFGVR
jgi:hypothetical protein